MSTQALCVRDIRNYILFLFYCSTENKTVFISFTVRSLFKNHNVYFTIFVFSKIVSKSLLIIFLFFFSFLFHLFSFIATYHFIFVRFPFVWFWCLYDDYWKIPIIEFISKGPFYASEKWKIIRIFHSISGEMDRMLS